MQSVEDKYKYGYPKYKNTEVISKIHKWRLQIQKIDVLSWDALGLPSV